eukprot:gene18224-20042_t
MNGFLLRSFSRNINRKLLQRHVFQARCCGGFLSTCAQKISPKSGITRSKQRSLSSSQVLQDQYDDVFKKSIQNPEEFWDNAAKDITWYKKYEKVLDNSNPPFSTWFPGGQLNTCYNALDYHVENGRGDRTAIIWDSPVSGNKERYSYREMQDQAAKFARILVDNGVERGDRVVIYLPMVPEAAIAMLGCARIGAVHSVVFGGFAPNELARRIDDAMPKIIVTASCGIEPHRLLPYGPLVEQALMQVECPPAKVIVLNRPEQTMKLKPGRDLDWHEEMANATPHDCVPVMSTDPLYILYTSGTTGKPKGITRSNGGHAVALKWSMKNIYDIDQDDVWWAASDIGWVVGHSYGIYAPLLYGCTSVMFEGKPINCPDGSVFFRVIDDHDVASLFTAPTAIRIIRNEDPDGNYAKRYMMSKFRTLWVAGEHADYNSVEWARKVFKTPVLDNWWQTETGWAMTCHSLGLGMPTDYKTVNCGKPVPVRLFNKQGNECKQGEMGNIVVKLPLPPGALSTLWQDDLRFTQAYHGKFEGYYDTCDAGVMDENGYLTIHGRVDDVIQVAGHRLSTKQMEHAISKHPDILEQAVIGIHDDIKGEVPIGLIVLKEGVNRHEDEIFREVINLVRKEVGQVSSFKKAIILPALPKTRSQKFIRSTLKKIINRDVYTIPQTVENADDFKKAEAILLKEFPGGMYK